MNHKEQMFSLLVGKFHNGWTNSTLDTGCATKIATLYENLQPIEFNKEIRCHAVVTCLINNKGNFKDATISKALIIPIRTIQDIRKELGRSGDLEMEGQAPGGHEGCPESQLCCQGPGHY